MKRNPLSGLGPLALAFVAGVALVLGGVFVLAICGAFFVDLGPLTAMLRGLFFLAALFAIYAVFNGRAFVSGLSIATSAVLGFLEHSALADPKTRLAADEEPSDPDQLDHR